MKGNGWDVHRLRWEDCPSIQTPMEIPGAKHGPVYNINIELLRRNEDQARVNFPANKMAELRRSVEQDGIMNPLHVRVLGAGAGAYFQLIGGERRWRTAKTLLYSTAPCIVHKPFKDERACELEGFKEGDLHEGLGPLEKAMFYMSQMAKYNETQAQVANHVNKSVGTISNYLQYMKLVPALKKDLLDDKITSGVARELATYPEDLQMRFRTLLDAEAEKKGRPLKQFEVGLILRRAAKKLKVKRNIHTPVKKGRIPYESGAYMATKASSLARQLKDSLEEVSKATKKEVEESNGHFLTVLQELNGLRPLVEKVCTRLNDEV